jgi:hypothetical protein
MLNPVDKHNQKDLHEWDIPEPGKEGSDLITQHRNDVMSKQCLIFVRSYINSLCSVLTELVQTDQLPQQFKNTISGIHLLCETPHYLKEIGTDSRSLLFLGINKPKKIVHRRNTPTQNLTVINPNRIDSDYRASYRTILLKLKNNKGNIRPWNKTRGDEGVKSLLLHELAHTMCNHIAYYNRENHLKDFKICEALLKFVDKKFLVNWFH